MATFTVGVILQDAHGSPIYFPAGATVPAWGYSQITNLAVISGTIPSTPPAGGNGVVDNGDGTATITIG